MLALAAHAAAPVSWRCCCCCCCCWEAAAAAEDPRGPVATPTLAVALDPYERNGAEAAAPPTGDRPDPVLSWGVPVPQPSAEEEEEEEEEEAVAYAAEVDAGLRPMLADVSTVALARARCRWA